MITVKELNKSFGSKSVLENINIDFEPGKVYGLLGRNGAGKTTLMRILSNYIVHYKGNVELDGKPIKENQKAIERILMIHKDMLPKAVADERIKTIFKFCAQLLPKWDSELSASLIADFDIDVKAKYARLSEGNKTLINLIIGLSSGADVKLFDEPSVGLDANNRFKFYKKLLEVHETAGDTVIVSSHIIDEIENVIEDVIIIKDCKILLNDEIANIQQKAIALTGYDELLQDIQNNKCVLEVETLGKMTKISLFDDLSQDERQDLISKGVEISVIPLQRFFIHLT